MKYKKDIELIAGILIFLIILVAVSLGLYFLFFLCLKASNLEGEALKQCTENGNSINYCKSLLY